MSARPLSHRYPRPRKTGGLLIRRVVRAFQNYLIPTDRQGLKTIAVSGGADSIALAHLIIKYGRKIAPRSDWRILHIDHQWRGETSKADARFVQEFANSLDVPVSLITLRPEDTQIPGESWEQAARVRRKQIYEQQVRSGAASMIITAHHADDLAETLLWRLFTGAAQTHGAGIHYQSGVEFRPLLEIRKSLLLNYLEEEGLAYRQDETNEDTRFLRAKIRQKIIPEIESCFPKAVEHLVDLALSLQKNVKLASIEELDTLPLFQSFFAAAGLQARQPHLRTLVQKLETSWQGKLDFPNGWSVVREIKKSGLDSWTFSRSSPDLSLAMEEESSTSAANTPPQTLIE